MITGCIETRPTVRTVRLLGTPISLSKLCVETGIAVSYLSYIMAGKKTPSIPVALNISEALGIGLESLLDGLVQQKPTKKRKSLAPKVNKVA